LLVRRVRRSSVSMSNRRLVRTDPVLESLRSAANYHVRVGIVLDIDPRMSGNECKHQLGQQLTQNSGAPSGCVSTKVSVKGENEVPTWTIASASVMFSSLLSARA